MQERKSLHGVEEALEDGGRERCTFEGSVLSNKSPMEHRSVLWAFADRSWTTGQKRGAWLLLHPCCLATPASVSP